jgi:hypothetical protein
MARTEQNATRFERKPGAIEPDTFRPANGTNWLLDRTGGHGR